MLTKSPWKVSKGEFLMQRFWFILIALLLAATGAIAQSAGDYHRWEVAGTFVYAKQEANSGEQFIIAGPDAFSFHPCTPEGKDALGANLQQVFCLRRGYKGASGTVAFNLKRYAGLVGDFTGLFKNETTVDDFGHIDTNKIRHRTWEV